MPSFQLTRSKPACRGKNTGPSSDLSSTSTVKSTSKSKSELERVSLRRKPSAGILSTSVTPSGTRTTRITTTTATVPAQVTGPRLARDIATKTTTTQAPKPTLASRHPLRARDQNAAPLRPLLKAGLAPNSRDSMTTARMPSYEKASSSSTTSSRQPQLPTVARGISNKPPLTPKIAARSTASQQQPNVAFVTPVPRRVARPESLLSSGHGGTPKEELTSPVAAFLNTNNITPRSGSRQSRVNSANSTPNGTPKLERSDSWEARSGLGISAPGADDSYKKPAVALSPPLEVGGMLRQDNADSKDSKFFYASEAQRPASMISPKPPPVQQQQRPATFFYANGGPPLLPQQQQRDNAQSPLATPIVVTTSPQEAPTSKFIYANGTPDLQPPTKTRPSSVVSSSSRIPTTRPTSGLPMSPYSSQRSLSPVKLSHNQQPNSGSNSALTSPRSPIYAASSLSTQSGLSQATRPPVQPANKPSTTRSGSLTFAEPPAVARVVSTHSSVVSSECTSPVEPSAPQPINPATTGFASLLQAAEDFVDDEETRPESLNSPTKASSHDGQLTELVANARRERKVQDLQITNASLEAINRTLERQLRKQTAEIRRYKRLSRSGRLSMASAGSRIPSGSSVDGGGLARAGLGLDDLSEEESDMEEQEAELEAELQDEEYMSASDDSGELSPEAIAERDTRHRRRDEKRLQLDLTKHQQLLIDSQKINQSLKRCLGWTEELIKEGKRALEYKVRVSEISLGGRVLAPEEIEGEEEEDMDVDADEDDTIIGMGLGRSDEPPSDTSRPWNKDSQDRDSGIELPTDGG
ncbi:hypothetical protein V8F33_008628 [Rhypophila sp. PSN 637]